MKNPTKTNKKTNATENNIVYCNTAGLNICSRLDSLYIQWYGKIKKYKPINDTKITNPKDIRIGKSTTKVDRIIFSCRERNFINKKSVLGADIYNDIRPIGTRVKTHEFKIYKYTSSLKLLKALLMIEESSNGLNETLLFCFTDSDIPFEILLEADITTRYLNEKGYKRKVYVAAQGGGIDNTRIAYYK